MKIVINSCYGGFGLSDAAYEYLIAQGVPLVEEDYKGKDNVLVIRKWKRHSSLLGKYWDFYFDSRRNDPKLIEVVEKLGAKASGHCAELKIVEIPEGIDYEISEYDGFEHIAEKHRTWS
jgi:hypothetical protein